MNKKIIIAILVMTLLVLTSCSNKQDNKNEEILKKLLELEKIDINNVNINGDTILVSMEASSADEYDTQILEWWGTIFGLSGMLKGDYVFVIIENTVNKEPYTYISTNVYTIRDFNEDEISDMEFWQETLITEKKPSTNEIIKQSGLPASTLSDERKNKVPMTLVTSIILGGIALIILILLLVFGKRFFKKRNKTKIKKTHEKNEKKHEIKHESKKEEQKKEHEEKTTDNKKEEHKQKQEKKHEQKKDHLKNITNKIKKGTNKLKEKTKEKTRSFREKLKQEPGR